jgi:transcriptional regulator
VSVHAHTGRAENLRAVAAPGAPALRTMPVYVPHEFQVADRNLLHDLIERFSFAMLVTTQDGRPVASHLPFLVQRDAGDHGTLVGHMARANRQWKDFERSGEALVIFQGEHGYVSPSWYETHPSVPTWNYLAVHAYGIPHVIEDAERIRTILRALVAKNEAGFDEPWPMDLPNDYLRKMIGGIVVFEIPLTRLEGKFKLSQNRPVPDRRRVIATLAASVDPTQRALATAMQVALDRAGSRSEGA